MILRSNIGMTKKQNYSTLKTNFFFLLTELENSGVGHIVIILLRTFIDIPEVRNDERYPKGHCGLKSSIIWTVAERKEYQ